MQKAYIYNACKKAETDTYTLITDIRTLTTYNIM